MKIGCIRTQAKALRGPKDGELREVDVVLELYGLSEDPAIRLIGGPCGYESFYVEDFLKRVRAQRESGTTEPDGELTWRACMGTVGRWDTMIVSHEEMERAFLAFGIKV